MNMTSVWRTGRATRRAVSIFLMIALFIAMIPSYLFGGRTYAASDDGPYTKEWTQAGIKNDLVFGYRIKLNSNTTVVKKMSNLGVLILREKLSSTSYKFYLVGKDGEVKKTWSTKDASSAPYTEVFYTPIDPEEGLLNLDGEKAYPYNLMSVKDPNTGKVDIYNPDTGDYYSHQMDGATAYLYDGGAYPVGTKGGKYTVLTPDGDIAYSDLYFDRIEYITMYDNVLYFSGIDDLDSGEECTVLSSDGKLTPQGGYASTYSIGFALGQTEYEGGITDKYIFMYDESGKYRVLDGSTGKYIGGSTKYNEISYAGDGVFYGQYDGEYVGYDYVQQYKVFCDETSFDVAQSLGYNRCKITSDHAGANGNIIAYVYNVDDYGDTTSSKNVVIDRYGTELLEGPVTYLYNNCYLYEEDDASYTLRSLDTGNVIMKNAQVGFGDVGAYAGHYLLVENTDTGQYSWVNCKTGKVVLKNVSDQFRFYSMQKGAGFIMLPEEDSGKYGIIDTVSDKFSGYTISGDISFYLNDALLGSVEADGKGIIIVKDDEENQLTVMSRSADGIQTVKTFTDAGLGSSDQNHNYLICDREKEVYYVARRDGTLSSAFYLNYKTSYRGHNLTITNKANNRFGIASADGTVILPASYYYAGNEANGVNLVIDDSSYSSYGGEEYYSGGFVDYYGDWLIKGKYYFDTDEDSGAGRNLVLQGASGYYYFYDLTDYVNELASDEGTQYYNHKPSQRITEDDIYGPYYKYLNNRAYRSMANALSGGLQEVLGERSWFDNSISVLIGNMKQGGVTSFINAIKCDVTGKYYKQDELEEQLAMEFIEEMGKDYSFMEDLTGDMSKYFKWTEKTYQIIEAGFKNAAEKKELAKMLACPLPGDVGYTMDEALEIIRETDKNWDEIDDKFDIAGEAVNLAEVSSTVFVALTMDRYMVARLIDMVEDDSSLERGLLRIQKMQDRPVAEIFRRMLDDGIFSKISSELTKNGVGKLASMFAKTGGIKVGMATTVASIGYYITGSLLSKVVADSDAVMSAYIASDNITSIHTALTNTFSSMASQKTGKDLKDEYITLYKAYVAALKVGAEKGLAAAKKGDKKNELQADYDKYKNRLTYEGYISSCIRNANAEIKYTVENGKATIVGYNSSGKQTNSLNSAGGKKSVAASDEGMYIDIPDTVDGYEVGSVSKSAFRNKTDIAGVYVPQGVTSIGDRTFDGCVNLKDVFFEEGLLSIGKESFRNCSSLIKITLPKSVTEIGESCFSGIDKVTVKTTDTAAIDSYVGQGNDNVTVEKTDPPLKSIAITKSAAKKTYNMSEIAEIEAGEGENGLGLPDLTGLELEATYEDGTKKTITEGFAGYFEEKKLGENTVTVMYGDKSTSYTVNVVADDCKWELICLDECGNEIAERETGTLKAGDSYVSSAREIEGYELVSDSQLNYKIGADNRFEVHYRKIQKPSIYDAKVTLSKTSYSYTGKALKPAVTVTYKGEKLIAGQDYTLKYDSNVKPGSAAAVIEGIGEYDGMAIEVFKINKAANKMTAKPKSVKVKYKKLKKKTQKIKKAKAFTIKSAIGTVSFKLKKKDKKAKSKITISRSGVITVKKGLKKGKYKIIVAVTAAGNFGYTSKTKQLTVTIKVK